MVGPITRSPEIKPVIAFHDVSKWYGDVIGINKLTLDIMPGVCGLLGPNGAGKSTLLQLATGQLCPSQGRVEVLGETVWNNSKINRYIGLCPEQDALYEWMTGRDFITCCARLAGCRKHAASAKADELLELVGMTTHANRVVRGYSKGMRQRTKLAQALVNDPQVLFLDEPMTGTDPVARRDLLEIIHRLALKGKTILVSSHVLYEVQTLTENIVLMNHGRLVAQGSIRQIRDLMDQQPHRIVLIGRNIRSLGAKLLEYPDVAGVHLGPDGVSLVAQTPRPDEFYARLPSLALGGPWTIDEVYSEDDNLDAVFHYLVDK
jgi:ABC-2 type transport system ATP-binding protein